MPQTIFDPTKNYGIGTEGERMQALMRQRQAANPGVGGGPYGTNPFDQRARRADQSILGQPVDLNRASWEARNMSAGLMESYPGSESPSPQVPESSPSGPFGMAPKSQRQSDPFARGAGYQFQGPDDPFNPRPRKRFAEGGEVEGPGGPKDDMVPAMLSDGEFIMPAEAVEFFGTDRLQKMIAKAKESSHENPMKSRKPSPMDAMPMPGYAEGGYVDKIGIAAARSRMREQDAMLSPVGYSPTLLDSPVFQPLPVSPSPRPQVPQSPGPRLLTGSQPPLNFADPMPEPTMRPAPMTMTEKERMMMPPRPSSTPMAPQGFEDAMAGLTGMEKRKLRQNVALEAAQFGQQNQRAQVAQGEADMRAAQDRAMAFDDWQRKQVISDQFNQATEKRRYSADTALSNAAQAEKDRRDAAAAESNRRFSPVLDDQGNPIPGRMMNPQGQQLNLQPESTPGITMMPVPGTQGQVIPMMGGSRVPGMPVMQAQTQPGPFREGLGRTSYAPVQETPAAKTPSVRKTAPMKGATAEAPQWEYASLSDGSTRPITIDNPRTDQTRDRFMHQYGKAPQTEQEWTEAWYLTTGQPMPARGAAQPSAAAATTRAKIKSITPVT